MGAESIRPRNGDTSSGAIFVIRRAVSSSWLREDRSYTVLVQSLTTNEVMTITSAPNQNNLRLVRLNLNSDPRLVEAVISDGNELRAIKFHFDGQTPTDLGNSGAGQLSGAGEHERIRSASISKSAES